MRQEVGDRSGHGPESTDPAPRQRLLPGEPVWALLETPAAKGALASLTPEEREESAAVDRRLNPFGGWRATGSVRTWALAVGTLVVVHLVFGPLAGTITLVVGLAAVAAALARAALRPALSVEEAERRAAEWLAGTATAKAAGRRPEDFMGGPTPGERGGDNGGEVDR